jgi:hypothetical protein
MRDLTQKQRLLVDSIDMLHLMRDWTQKQIRLSAHRWQIVGWAPVLNFVEGSNGISLYLSD